MELQLKRSGALFGLGNVPNNAIQRFNDLQFNGTIDSSISDFIQILFNLCTVDVERITDMKTLEGQGISRAGIIRRCKKLIDMGLMDKSSHRQPGKRSSTFYILKEIDNLVHVEKESNTKEVVKTVPAPINATSLLIKEARQPLSWKGDRFSIFTLLSALPTGRSGKYTDGSYSVPIWIGKEKLELTVLPASGRKSATALDLRVLGIMITLVHANYTSTGKIQNPFIVHVNDIIELLGRNKGTGNKQYVAGAIERWALTNFEITSCAEGIVDQFKGRIELSKIFKVIDSLQVLTLFKDEGKCPESFAFSLGQDLIERIKHQDVLTMHPESFTEKNALAYKIYLWCRRAMQHYKKYPKGKLWKIEHLHREMEPLRQLKEFKKSLKRLLAARHDELIGGALFYGYIVTASDKMDSVWIKADPEDRLIGRNSFFARMVSSSESNQKELENIKQTEE